MICEEARGLISAYQDGELSADTRSSIEEHLKGCAECMAAYRLNLRVSEAIRAKAPTFAPPEALLKRLPGRERTAPVWAPFGAGLSLGLAAAVIAVFVFRPRGSDFTGELVSDHVRSLMAAHLVDVVSSDRHTVKPWFLGKLDFAPQVPELRPQGYPLLGGRLDYVGGHIAAALIYGKQKHVINVLVMPESQGSDTSGESNGYRVEHWQEADLGYWAVSDVSRDDLRTFAKAFRNNRN